MSHAIPNLIDDLLGATEQVPEIDDRARVAGEQVVADFVGPQSNSASASNKLDWNELETVLADLWTDVLGIPPEGLDQSFFAAGGHSLSAVRLFVGIRDRFACNVPFRVLFASPTIRQIAAYVRETQPTSALYKDGFDEVLSQSTELLTEGTDRFQVTVFPAAYPQRSLWTLDQMNDDLTAYNIPLAWRIDGPLDVEVLRLAIEQVVHSHEPLRTVFEQDPVGVWQRILPKEPWDLSCVDLASVSWAERGEAAMDRILEESLRPWNLRGELPLRTTLYKIDTDSHLLLFVLHHIAVDGWSLHCLRNEISDRYRCILRGTPSSLPSLRSRYAAYANWQRRWMTSDEAQRDLNYWKNALNGLEPLDLPTDFPRPVKFTFRGQAIPFQIDPDRLANILAFCAKHHTTPHVFLLAVFQLALAVYADAEEASCIVPIASRDRSEWENLIGYFINSVVVRTQVPRDCSFLELLAQVHRSSADAYDHSRLPFEAVVEGIQTRVSQDRNPIAQTLFQLMDFATSDLQLEGTKVAEQEVAIDRVRFDLEMILHAAIDANSGKRVLRGNLSYCTDLWSQQTMLAFLDYYLTLVDRCLHSPSDRLQNCTLISERMSCTLEELEAGPREPELIERSVMEMIDERIAKAPQSPALVQDSSTWNYRQTDVHTEVLANALVARGVRPGDRVAVLLERSPETIFALLAIWRIGAVYLPLDPQYPQERLVYFLRDAQPAILLTTLTLQSKLEFSTDKTLLVDTLKTDSSSSDGLMVSDPTERPNRWQYDRGHTAYLLYTSGSTGKPKGVEVSHRTLANFVAWHVSHPRLGRPAIALQFAPLSFDVSLQEIASTLATGGTLVLIDEDTRQDPFAMLEHLRKHDVQRLFLPFVMLDALAVASEGTLGNPARLGLDLQDIISAGESLRLTAPIRRFVEQFQDCVLHNHYGPTETHVITETMIELDQFGDGQEVPIGRPIPNCQTLILDRWLKRVPRGAVGDLYLAGDALANGYLNRPELNAERFIEVPAESLRSEENSSPNSQPVMRMYRSGDRARWRWDGALDFLGRLDDQVKFRGHRIELGEIAHRVGLLEGVRQAQVAVRKVGTTTRLVAYVVLKRTKDEETVSEDGAVQGLGSRSMLQGWRVALQQTLPSYMLPQDFVILEEFPRTPSGKLDLRNLPIPILGDLSDSKDSNECTIEPPSTALQALLVELLRELLGGGPISVRTPFLDLGMHSLLAMRFASIIQKRLQELGSAKRIPVRWLFQFPTIELLASQFAAEGISDEDDLKQAVAETCDHGSLRSNSSPTNLENDATPQSTARGPLSPSQRRLWFLDQLEGDTTHYHIHAAWKWKGRCDLKLLRSALEGLIDRHASLRTIYVQDAGVPYQCVRETGAIDFQVLESAEVDASEFEEHSSDQPISGVGVSGPAKDWLLDRIRAKFDLAKDTLLRASVVRLSEKEFIVSLVVHHIAADGQSMAILKHDLFRAYRNSLLNGGATKQKLNELDGAVQYLDYVREMESGIEGGKVYDTSEQLQIGQCKYDKEIAYWKEQLQDLPLLELPTDFRRPERLTYRGSNVRQWIDSERSRKIEQVCRELRCSPNTLLLAGFKLLLARYARQQDIAVAMPVHGRENPQFDSVVGFFVNTLIVRTQSQDQDTLREWVDKVGRSVFDALEHRHVPFEQLVEVLSPERRLNQSPWTSLMFQWLDQRMDVDGIEGVQIDDFRLHCDRVRFDLEMHWFQGNQGLVAELHYTTDLFDATFAKTFLQQYLHWIDAIAEDASATTQQVRFLTRKVESQICDEWNAEGWREATAGRVEEHFWEQVRRTPQQTALLWNVGSHDAECWTYRELGAYANQIAMKLQDSGVDSASRVAVLLSRSPEYVASILAILSLGGTYVPLDAKYPVERLALMLEDSEAVGIICDAERKELANALHSRCVAIPASGQWLHAWRTCEDQGGEELEHLGVDNRSGIDGSTGSYQRAAGASVVAYVMYTSGSTGKPKGVAIPHSGITRLVINPNYMRMDPSKRFAFLSSVAFDASTFEIWGALLNGATLAIAPEEELLDLQLLSKWMQQAEITTAWLTVGLFNTWMETYPQGLSGLSEILTGGEALSIPHILTAQEKLGRGVQLINGYGPTENTTFTTCHPIPVPWDATRKSIPIGKPIRGTRAYVVDAQLRLVPPGIPGELLTAGHGLATGYLGDAAANQEKFVTEHSIPDEERLYRTGDLCRWLSDGTLEFLGRVDHQIKLRGFRIEPNEIQSTLEACSSVQRAYVHVVRSGTTAIRLEAFVIAQTTGTSSVGWQRQYLNQVKQQLRERLPAYMIPERFYVVDHFPLTSNGKIDARRLAQSVEFDASDLEIDQGTIDDEVTRDLRWIWVSLLRKGSSSHQELHDNLPFFDAGGHSLLAIQLFHQIEKTFQVRLPLATIFRHGTIRMLAEQIRLARRGDNSNSWVKRMSLTEQREVEGVSLRPTVYVLPGVGGELLFAGRLVKEYADVFDWVGLQPNLDPKKCDKVPLDDFKETAKAYVQSILEHRRTKKDSTGMSFGLIGFSYGGMLAYEVARQLREAGLPADALIVLDTGPGPGPRVDRFEALGSLLMNMPGWFCHELPRMKSPVWWKQAVQKLTVNLGKWRRSPEELPSIATIFDINNAPSQNAKLRERVFHALLNYQPERFEGKVTLVRSRVQPLLRMLPKDYGWSQVAGEVKTVVLPGDHESFLHTSGNIDRIAQALIQAIPSSTANHQ